jgi:hypothetical protein
VVLRAGKLVGSHYPSAEYHGHEDFSWVYKAMEIVSVDFQDDWDKNTIAGVSGLLNALLYYGSPPLKQHIHLVLRALSTPGDISHDAARLLVQDNILQWFQENETKSILQTACVWSSFMRSSQQNTADFRFRREVLRMGHGLANIPSWMAQIREELCSWIILLFGADSRATRGGGLLTIAHEYNSVLQDIWTPDTGGYQFIDRGEEAYGLTFIVLSKAWKNIDFASPKSMKKSLRLLCATRWVVARAEYRNEAKDEVTHLSERFNTAFSVPLHNSLMQAAARARDMIRISAGAGDTKVLENIAKMLDVVNKTHGPGEKEDEQGLPFQFENEIGDLEDWLQTSSALVESPAVE